MKNIQQNTISKRDILLWLGVVLVTVAAFWGTYNYHFSAPIKVLIWIGWFVFALGLAFFTEKGKQIYLIGKDAKQELQKVVWPSRQETIQTTSIVMVMVGVTGFILWGIDSGMMWVIAKLTHLD